MLHLAGIKGQAERKYAAYTFTENDKRKIVKFIVAWLNNFYSNQKVIMRGRSVKSYQQDKEKHITNAVLREYTEYIYENNKPSKRIIDFSVQYNVGKKNAQNLVMYLRRYAAEKAVSGYVVSQNEYNILRDELAKSGKQGKEINIADKIYEMALQRYSTVDYQALISNNPFYVKNLEYLQKANASYNELQYYLAKRNELIIKEIPENIVDVYPMARNMKRHFIIHVGQTNSGKTYAALNVYKSAVHGVYLAPLRLLAYEVFEQMNNEGVACTMLTGEEEIQVPFSEHYSATVEMTDVNMYFDVAVIDECQMCTDRQRG